MASKFVIREKTTNTFCTSQKLQYFSRDLQDAALFESRNNAEKAVRGMRPKEMNPYGGHTWSIMNENGRVQAFHKAFLKEYIEELEKHPHAVENADYLKKHGVELAQDLEVVEVKLVIV